jgi:hypothetical protein|tara:strand:- start:3122 stop:3592 length:471 start_codon:yes stop_codon:yes gene_type:complete
MIMEILTDEILVDILKDEGYPQEPDGIWILELIQTEYGGNLDYNSSWAKGNEDLICYTQSTADNYELYICTDNHNNNVNWDGDVYYYLDNSEFADRILEVLKWGQEIWCDTCIWDDIEYEVWDALIDWYEDFYEDKRKEKEIELINNGEYKLEENE